MNSTPQASQGALWPKAARGIMAALIQWGLSADNILLLFGSVWLGSVLFCSVFFGEGGAVCPFGFKICVIAKCQSCGSRGEK